MSEKTNSDIVVSLPAVPVDTRSSRRRRTAGGFTLIELLAVVVILGLVSISAAPVISGMSHTRRAAAATQVLRDLHSARQRAVSCGIRTWVVFAPDDDTYALMTENVEAPGRSNRVALDDPVTGRPLVVNLALGLFAGSGIDAVEIADGTEVGFDYLGRPLTMHESILQTAGEITLAGDHEIRIEPRTGHCYVE